MRARLALVLIPFILFVTAAPAFAHPHTVVAAGSLTVAQTEQPQEEDAGGEEGQSEDAETETDPGEGEEAAIEEGPLWTYQMARLALLGLVPLIAALAWWYYRFVVSRARES